MTRGGHLLSSSSDFLPNSLSQNDGAGGLSSTQPSSLRETKRMSACVSTRKPRRAASDEGAPVLALHLEVVCLEIHVHCRQNGGPRASERGAALRPRRWSTTETQAQGGAHPSCSRGQCARRKARAHPVQTCGARAREASAPKASGAQRYARLCVALRRATLAVCRAKRRRRAAPRSQSAVCRCRAMPIRGAHPISSTMLPVVVSRPPRPSFSPNSVLGIISAAFFFSLSNTLSSAARHRRREARRRPARAGAARRNLACGAASGAAAKATHVVAILCGAVPHARRSAA